MQNTLLFDHCKYELKNIFELGIGTNNQIESRWVRNIIQVVH